MNATTNGSNTERFWLISRCQESSKITISGFIIKGLIVIEEKEMRKPMMKRPFLNGIATKQ